MLFRQINDDQLAQYAYLIGCQRTKEALLIDPERDIDRYLALAAQEKLTITAVTETHIHADFLSGARALAEKTGARLYLSDEGDADWKYEWAKDSDLPITFLHDGDTFRVGNIEIKAIHTPGHTPEHLAFLVTDHGGGADQPMGLATGDFVFVGDVGRPDLLETAAKQAGAREPSARRLFVSAKWFLEQPAFLQVWPGHGAGSACGKALGAVPQSTVGYEQLFNTALAAARDGEAAFVQHVLDGQTEPPLYFARMKTWNKKGVPPLDALPQPRPLAPGDLPGLGHPVVLDTRADRRDFMRRHVPGSLYAPFNASFATTVGSLVEDPETPLVLVIEAAKVDAAVRALVRIGFDRVTGYVTPEALAAWFEAGGEAAQIEVAEIRDLEALRHQPGTRVLDVRYQNEFDETHVPDALHVAYTRLPEHVDELPIEETLLVHCQSGARSAAASAYLARTGRRVVYVDGPFSEWKPAATLETHA